MATFEPMIGKVFVHKHPLDDVPALSTTYLKLSGGIMTGQIDMVQNGIIMQDTNSQNWIITVNDQGALVTTSVTMSGGGNPIGLLLALTYTT